VAGIKSKVDLEDFFQALKCRHPIAKEMNQSSRKTVIFWPPVIIYLRKHPRNPPKATHRNDTGEHYISSSELLFGWRIIRIEDRLQ
jgi:hypothetical protein